MGRASTCRAACHKQIRWPEISRYMRSVETGRVRSCERQKKLMRYVRRVFATEKLFVDKEQLADYIRLSELFDFEGLYPWEEFLLALFMCTYKADGMPRWDELIDIMGRGAGKNGFISFLSLCAITPANGIRRYHVNIVANSEEQAKTSPDEVREMLDARRAEMQRSFEWNKVDIRNKKTGSKIKYLTSNASTKDGGRPGMVVFDEVHEYKLWKIIEVLTTGLGKVDHPRIAYISSYGDVRDGVLDTLVQVCDDILDGKVPDEGRLPFVCTLDRESEVDDEQNWEKPNPSLPYQPERIHATTRKEYRKWKENPTANASFMTRRMGLPQGDVESEVTSWENLVAASRSTTDLRGRPCVCGIDFARTSDFVSACLLFRDGDEYEVLHHSWFCLHSRDRTRIKAPLEEWARAGLLTLVSETEIAPRVLADWLYEQAALYDIGSVAIDDYRYTIVMEALRGIGYAKDEGTVRLVRPSDHARVFPVMEAAFNSGRIAWGDDPMMRWFTNNTKVVPWQNGNFKFDKIDPKPRKTDGFMALVAAFCIADRIPEPIDDEVSAPIMF